MKHARPLVAIGAIAYLLVLLVNFPATQVVPMLERQVPGLSLQAVSGSVFSGQARRLVYQRLDLGPVTWGIRPAMLLLGRLEYHLVLSSPDAPGQASIAITPWGRVHGHDIDLVLMPEAIINRYSPMPVRTSGEIHAHIDEFSSAGAFPDKLAGLLSWKRGAVLEPIELLLGDLAMRLETREGAVAGNFVEGGRLQGSGGILVSADGRYQLDLRIVPDSEMSEDTLAGLQMFWQRQPDGALAYTTTGRF